MGQAPSPLVALDTAQLQQTSATTLSHYDRDAEAFWRGTRHHDVSQNISALLDHLGAGKTILDLGCGPGRDLITFRDLGHTAIGLDGAQRFVQMAQENSGCQVLHQDLLDLKLPSRHFDGVFANAVLFHVPSQELPAVLAALWESLNDNGILFSSNPHGPNREGWSGDRYCCYLDLDTYQRFMTDAGFLKLSHYYRPSGRPRESQPWLASVWGKRPRACS